MDNKPEFKVSGFARELETAEVPAQQASSAEEEMPVALRNAIESIERGFFVLYAGMVMIRTGGQWLWVNRGELSKHLPVGSK